MLSCVRNDLRNYCALANFFCFKAAPGAKRMPCSVLIYPYCSSSPSNASSATLHDLLQRRARHLDIVLDRPHFEVDAASLIREVHALPRSFSSSLLVSAQHVDEQHGCCGGPRISVFREFRNVDLEIVVSELLPLNERIDLDFRDVAACHRALFEKQRSPEVNRTLDSRSGKRVDALC